MKNNGVFIITGASQGLGSVIAAHALKAGFSVALIGRSKSKLAAVEKKLRTDSNSSSKITSHAVELTKEKAVRSAFANIQAAHGPARALVNNAGTWTGGKSVKQLSRGDMQASLDLNFFSAFNATKAFLSLKKRTPEVSIVNIGATSSLQGWENVSAFCVAKNALRVFSQSTARELGPEGIHVAHIVIDGLLDNERTRKLNPKVAPNRFINMDAVAKTVMHVALQEKSCWTFELDVRPHNENW